MMVALGYTIDNYVIKSGDVLKTGIMFFYISNEGISILENISHMGLPIPKYINEVFANLVSAEQTKTPHKPCKKRRNMV